MSASYQIMYAKSLPNEPTWVALQLSGIALQEIKQTKQWIGRLVIRIRYPNGDIWNCTLSKFEPKGK